ncbi:MAG: PAS domain-containing protein [Candidatus Obscuribacterales bacterium]|nr:PAS domain-containing protein [Candidatus Obscuribacterales bacterium]
MTVKQLSSALDNVPIGIIFVDSDWTLSYTNHKAKSIFSGVDNVIGQDFRNVANKTWSQNTANWLIGKIEHTLKTGEAFSAEQFSELPKDSKPQEYFELNVQQSTRSDGQTGIVCYFTDITKLINKQHLIEQSRREFHDLANAMPQMVWTATSNGALEFTNETMHNYLGVDNNTARSWQLTDWLHQDNIETVSKAWQNALETGEPYEVDAHIKGKDGTYRWFLTRGVPSRDENGKVIKWYGTCTDTTTQKEDLLLFKSLFDLMPQLGWTAKTDGYIDLYNKGWYEFTGSNLEQMKGWGWESVHDPEYLPRVKALWQEALAVGDQFEIEFPIRKHNGKYEWFLTRATPIRTDDGKITRWVGINSNIQAQRDGLHAVQESERRFRLLADTLPDLVWIVDGNLNLQYVNERFYEYTGMEKPCALGTGWQNIVHPECLVKAIEDWKEPLRDKTPYEGEQRLRAADGSYRWFLIRGIPILDEHGSVHSWFGTSTDIHVKKEAREELEKLVKERTDQLRSALAEAEQASSLKSQFVSTISHEVRTPVSGVIGLAEYLTTVDLEPSVAEIVGHILQASKSLLSILNDLLDFSKLEAGKVDIDYVSFDPESLINDSLVLFEQNCKLKGISLKTEFSKDLPNQICSDEQKTRQILTNLLANAVKFTESGGITIRASVVEHPLVGSKLRLSVSDTGIGISQNQQDILFQPFVQADGSMTRRFGGTGLGLSISKRYVELLGGEIGCESILGKGSTFWFTVPYLNQEQESKKISARQA